MSVFGHGVDKTQPSADAGSAEDTCSSVLTTQKKPSPSVIAGNARAPGQGRF